MSNLGDGHAGRPVRGRLRFLEGYVVLDMTGAMAGPFATDILCGLGATVIKIERPTADGRGGVPVMASDGLVAESSDPDAMSIRPMTKNYSKLSVALELKTSEGRELFHKLIKASDAFVHNYKPSTAKSLKVTASDITPLNPSIVYVSLDGLGPYASGVEEQLPVIDPSVESIAGTIIDAEPGGHEPRYGQFAIADCAGGLYSAIAVLAGLLGRDGRTGLNRGTSLSVSMLGALLAMACETPYDAQVRFGVGSGAGGGRPPEIPGLGVWKGADERWLYLTAVNDDQWRRLARATRIPEFANPEYETRAARVRNTSKLYALLDEWAAGFSRDEVIEQLRAEGVSAWPIRTHAEVVADERLRETFFYDLEHPLYGPTGIGGVRLPITTDNADDCLIDTPPPLPGQDTKRVLERYAGIAPDEAADLQGRGIIFIRDAKAKTTAQSPPL